MKAPAVPEVPVPVITEPDLRKLPATASGKTFEDKRDLAMMRLLMDTGMRAGELIGMRLEDLERDQGVAFVVGKGRRPRACPYGDKTAAALDRYLRLRNRHRLAGEPWLWVGNKGQLTDSGLRQILERRSEEAGTGHVHPHMLRHSSAHQWLAQGGQETDLMRLAGWRSRQMVGRCGASAADERSRDAHRRMALGDRI